MELYAKAAELGNADAMRNLSYCPKHGYGIEKDYQKAEEWYKKAIEGYTVAAEAGERYAPYFLEKLLGKIRQ